MGIYLLNISVDAADLNPQYIKEDLSFNDQESIVEIIVEQVLGYHDAIQEYDDHDAEEHNNKCNTEINLVVHNLPNDSRTQSILRTRKQRFQDLEAFLATGFHQLDVPPPKA